jgi:hypothetical protein
MFEMPTYFVLILYCIRRSLLKFQSILQILLGIDLVPTLILQHESKISNYPQKGRKAAGILSRLAVGLGLDILGEIDDEVESIECIFIDAAY